MGVACTKQKSHGVLHQSKMDKSPTCFLTKTWFLAVCSVFDEATQIGYTRGSHKRVVTETGAGNLQVRLTRTTRKPYGRRGQMV